MEGAVGKRLRETLVNRLLYLSGLTVEMSRDAKFSVR